jgi:hypothetical protein
MKQPLIGAAMAIARTAPSASWMSASVNYDA